MIQILRGIVKWIFVSEQKDADKTLKSKVI